MAPKPAYHLLHAVAQFLMHWHSYQFDQVECNYHQPTKHTHGRQSNRLQAYPHIICPTDNLSGLGSSRQSGAEVTVQKSSAAPHATHSTSHSTHVSRRAIGISMRRVRGSASYIVYPSTGNRMAVDSVGQYRVCMTVCGAGFCDPDMYPVSSHTVVDSQVLGHVPINLESNGSVQCRTTAMLSDVACR